MRIGRYRFRPPWWGITATAVCAALFVVAGVWQINRGQAKALMLTQQEAASKTAAVPLAQLLAPRSASTINELYGTHVSVRGHYVADHQILLDSQVFKGNVGYRVWTPLVMDDGRLVLVDRGWIAMGSGGREDVPVPAAPAGQTVIDGVLDGWPEPGVRLGDAPSCQSDDWPRVLNYPTIDTIRCLYTPSIINGIVLLDANQPHGFARDWQVDTGMTPMRHYGYAVQWFAMAIAVVIVFLVVNMKRIR